MWTFPPAILGSVTTPTPPDDFGTLVVELLFETGAPGGPTNNTGSLGGTAVFGDGGTGNFPTIVTSGGFDGGYMSFAAVGGNPKATASIGFSSDLIIGTANFKIEVQAWFSTYATTFGQILWGWGNGSPSPNLIVGTDGNLHFIDGVISIDTGHVVDLDMTFRKYTLQRLNGVASVLVDDVEVYSGAYTSNCNVGYSAQSFKVGTQGNGSGGLSGAALDEFRFYNANV